jgi:hypothetical protein
LGDETKAEKVIQLGIDLILDAIKDYSTDDNRNKEIE